MHARAASRPQGGTEELCRLTASLLLVSERPLHSDTEVSEAERQRPTLCAAGSLQYELTFHCDIWWWLRETYLEAS